MRFLLILFSILFLDYSASAQTFYAVLVADTKDPSLGASCEKDLSDMSLLMAEVAKRIDFKYKEIVCNRDNFGKAGLYKSVSEINCAPNDVIFFYYTGHGLNTLGRASSFPLLYLKDDNDVELEKIHLMLKYKKPKFCVTLGDCCNNLFTDTRSMRPVNPIFKGIGVSKDYNIWQKLFVESEGDILISSAKRGERATAHPNSGSFYSNTWMQAINYAESHNANITWETLMLDAENRLQESLKHFPDTLKHHSQWIQNFHEAPVPCPNSSFNEVNKFLNTLANESLSFTERNAIRVKNTDKFFKNTAQVSIYINNPEKPVEIQSVDQFLKRVVTTAPLIQEFNFVERLSKVTDSCLYETVTLQEVRN